MARHQEPLFQRLIRSKLVMVFEIILLVGLATAVSREMVRRHQIQGEIEALEQQAAMLEKKNIELSDLISMVSAPDYQEEQARLQLGLQKPGETVVAVLGVDTERQTASSAGAGASPAADAAGQSGNPQRWLHHFISD